MTLRLGRDAFGQKVNPVRQVYGPGPDGKKCKTCKRLWHHSYRSNRRFYKCDLREFTHGTGSDHRVNWPACSRYEEET